MTWERAWQEGRTRWDAGESPPALHELLAMDGLPRGRAFVPGAGSGYDVFTLAEAGYPTVGLDVAPTAAKRFASLRAERDLPPEAAQLRVDDFFAFDSPPFELWWDYTFLCALQPSERERWADRVDALVAPAGEVATLIFPSVDRPLTEDGGPPFPLTPEHVRGLLEPRGWVATHLEPPRRSHPGREGKEFLARWRRAA
jgi:hypothetical protein